MWVLLLLALPRLTAEPVPLGAGERLRTVVWPVLSSAAPGGPDGAVWATEPRPDTVRLHRLLYGPERELTEDVVLPADAAPAAAAEAVRLRLQWLLEAPPDAGQPWTGRLAAPPPPPLLPADRVAEITTAPPALPPPRATRVPPTPGEAPADPPAEDAFAEGPIRLDDEAAGAVGFEVVAQTLAWPPDPGLALGLTVRLADRWRVALGLAGHPFHDFERDGRALGVTALHGDLAARYRLSAADRVGLDLVGGVAVAHLSGVGGDFVIEGPQVGVLAGGQVSWRLAEPVALIVQADLRGSLLRARARFAGETLVVRDFASARLAVGLGWSL